MSAFLVDTSWMVDFLNGKRDAVHLISPLFEQGVAISIVTYAELYEGVLKIPDNDPRRDVWDELVSSVDVLGIDAPTARTFAELRSNLRARGQMIGDLDALIAATALRHELSLVSRDSDFERVPHLLRYP